MEELMAAQPDKQRLSTEAKDQQKIMTAEQAATLKNLAIEGREPEAFDHHLSPEDAALRIRMLEVKLAKDKSGRQHKPI
jgi:hypothetical protein